jgi:hypothetical protein
MLLAILVFISALAIAGCAAYFSIVGLTLLFVSSSLSIVVMGAALELGKLITVSFLHQQWEKINFLLKTYLIIASLVLSVITSVGIYGYLASGYNTTNIKVKSYEQLIESNNKLIEDLKNSKQALTIEPDYSKETDLLNVDKNKFVEQQLVLITQKEKRISELQASIEQERRKTAEQLNDAKLNLDSESKKELEQIKLFNDRLAILDAEVQTWMNQGTGGLFKQNGLEKARETKLAQESERAKIDEQIKAKQSSIEELRKEYTLKVKEISTALNERILAIEDRIKGIEKEITKDKQDIDAYVARVNESIAKINSRKETNAVSASANVKEKESEIQKLQTTNTELQAKIAQTDVGTFKFVASSIGTTLDRTVNWFIWSIMFVFDPLAVTLIICFNHLIKHRKKEKPPVLITTKVPEVTTTLTTTLAPVLSAEDTKPTTSEATSEEDQYQRILNIVAKQRQES